LIHSNFKPAIGPRFLEVVVLGSRGEGIRTPTFDAGKAPFLHSQPSRQASPFHDWNSEKLDFTVILLQKKLQSASSPNLD
jgi:hypothetical protein